ncbi:hypothetical protein CSV71_01195 [Sporosarcina sp. P21c]|uniref:hypothetical protein n=1 Tax=unclassified Sporosarcina TaxID=2647733 RepID=UPI000C163847|nr:MULTISPECIES: hypothetical protein [unclassified Sporosarcina]PIC68558.1 hypothetical protein CSV78_00385 [Sporosarcina sp. P16a]PIC91256.1 hypothetical protein CSV71_01195 [Sporosarcina sp. P21c]PIC93611.1 hypothetical protein CSV70_03725 [Sporosarcina sp. P25]
MNYSYEEFLEDLDAEREIHFIYKNEKYYMDAGTGRFMFWKFYDAASEIIGEDSNDLLRKVILEGKQIKEVWNLLEIDGTF